MAEEYINDGSAGVVDPQNNADGGADVSDGYANVNDSYVGEEGETGDGAIDHSSSSDTDKRKAQDAAFAKLRRERDASLREKEDLARETDRLRAELANITSKQSEQQTEELKKYEQELRDTYGLDPELLRKVVVSNNPEIEAIKKENQRLREDQHQQWVTSQWEELKSEFPELKDPEDVDPETWKKFNYGYSGINLTEAYILTNRKKLFDNAQKRATSKINSKNHLVSEKSEGHSSFEQDVNVSPEKLAVYRGFGYKDIKDIKNRERKYLKKKG